MTLGHMAPSLDDIEAIARRALDDLPEPFRALVGDVPIVVENFAEDAVLEELGIGDPFALMGLYQGIPIGNKETLNVPSGELDMIFLYRRPILDYWTETGDDLEHVVRHVLIHEIGHHFGLSDDDMERIEDSG